VSQSITRQDRGRSALRSYWHRPRPAVKCGLRAFSRRACQSLNLAPARDVPGHFYLPPLVARPPRSRLPLKPFSLTRYDALSGPRASNEAALKSGRQGG